MRALAPAERLGWLRFAIGGYAWIYLLARVPALLGTLRYPDLQFDPVGPMLLWSQPWPAAMLVAGLVFTIVSGAAFWLGWRFRWSGPAFAMALTLVLSYRNSWGMVFHTENLMVLHVIALGLGRSADACSIDAGFTRTPATSSPQWRYGWPIRLLAALTVLVYVLAGVAKLRHAGVDWVYSDALVNFVAYDNVRKVELGAGHAVLGSFLLRYPQLFPPLAAVSLAVELGAPIALLHRKLAWGWSVVAWSFHVGVLLVMYIFFPYPMLGFAYLPFFAVEGPAERMRGWIVARWRRGSGPRNGPPGGHLA